MAIATKPKPKQTRVYKKRHGKHQRRGTDFMKPYWPYLPLAAIVGIAMLFNSFWLQNGVLGYATNTTVSGLHVSTNAQRVQHGLGQLALNATLSQAAQAKANDMVNRNYWSHNTPDGQEPWIFISQVGYQYSSAGENLAYGFDNNDQTLVGWMNSPGHRANILNTNYTEVGFGIANSENYQGNGNQTVVVAMYARPSVQSVAVTAQVGQPEARPDSRSSVRSSNETAPQPEAQAQPEPTITEPVDDAPVSSPKPVASTDAEVPGSESQQQVARLQLVADVSPWSVALAVTLAVLLGVFILARHSVAWHKALVKGEKLVLKHKVLDVIIVSAIMIAIIMSQTIGYIQ